MKSLREIFRMNGRRRSCVVKLGSKVRDKITGFEGIAVSRCVYLNGCVSIGIESPVIGEKDGEPKRRDIWFDEQRVEVLEEGAFVPSYLETAKALHREATRATRAIAGGPQNSYPPRDGAR